MNRSGNAEGGSGSHVMDRTSRPCATEFDLKFDTCLAYLQTLKLASKDNEGVYSEFKKLMRDYKARSINGLELVAKVESLLKDRHDLILQFKAFVPEGYKLENIPKKPTAISQALAFVRKIKARYENLHRRFRNILSSFMKDEHQAQHVYNEVRDIWKNYPDLKEEFLCFLPEDSNKCFFSQVHMETSQVKIPQTGEMQHDLVCFKTCPKKSVDQSNEFQLQSPAHSKVRECEKQLDRDKTEHGWLVSDQELVEENKQAFIEQKERIAERFDDRPRGSEQIRHAAVSIGIVLNRNLVFLRLMKSILRFRPAELELLLFAKEANSSHECRKRVFSQHTEKGETETNEKPRKKSKRQPPTFTEANFKQEKEVIKQHLPNLRTPCRSSCTTSLEQDKHERYSTKETPNDKSSHATCKKSKERENNKENLYDKFSHITNNDGLVQCNDNRHTFKDKSCHVTTNKSVEEENSMRHPLIENPLNKSSRATSSSKYSNKPLSKLDSTKWEQCTPSYRLLPDDYPLPKVGSRLDEDCHVLNDKWVSATSGSEDYSFKCMRKNKYEKILRQCEDDRTDLDILLEYARSTIIGLEKLLKRSSKPGEVVVENYITDWHRRLISLIYHGCGPEVVECLHQKAGIVAPLILMRIKQKQKEWLKYKAQMRKVWAEVSAKNYEKSLDYNSVYNRQQEMISEPTTHIPDVMLEYPDTALREDIPTILQCSAKEDCSNTELTGLVHVWKEHLEPMFGLHYDCREDKEDLEYKLKDIGTESDQSIPQQDGYDELKYLEADEKACAASNGECSTQLVHIEPYKKDEREILPLS
ncbi:hypothetical protein GOP47_0023354 [Adiantum capillus-veneris]|uniref:Histone deacetylase interacting domain-containing protein n=1 Tax=Adiantum capillus-veneris TaxID=13818 RepID=A0A9D4Z4D8_ADICA|nr:hypothetical protein GOP47_0023354 [Adiantum capillus-veneris]